MAKDKFGNSNGSSNNNYSRIGKRQDNRVKPLSRPPVQIMYGDKLYKSLATSNPSVNDVKLPVGTSISQDILPVDNALNIIETAPISQYAKAVQPRIIEIEKVFNVLTQNRADITYAEIDAISDFMKMYVNSNSPYAALNQALFVQGTTELVSKDLADLDISYTPAAVLIQNYLNTTSLLMSTIHLSTLLNELASRVYSKYGYLDKYASGTNYSQNVTNIESDAVQSNLTALLRRVNDLQHNKQLTIDYCKANGYSSPSNSAYDTTTYQVLAYGYDSFNVATVVKTADGTSGQAMEDDVVAAIKALIAQRNLIVKSLYQGTIIKPSDYNLLFDNILTLYKSIIAAYQPVIAAIAWMNGLVGKDISEINVELAHTMVDRWVKESNSVKANQPLAAANGAIISDILINLYSVSTTKAFFTNSPTIDDTTQTMSISSVYQVPKNMMNLAHSGLYDSVNDTDTFRKWTNRKGFSTAYQSYVRDGSEWKPLAIDQAAFTRLVNNYSLHCYDKNDYGEVPPQTVKYVNLIDRLISGSKSYNILNDFILRTSRLSGSSK